MSRKGWFLLKRDEEAVKKHTVALFVSSYEFGRDCAHNCPDYSQGYGHLTILKTLDLIDESEFQILLEECKEEAAKQAGVKTIKQVLEGG